MSSTKTKIHIWTILIVAGFLFLASGTVALAAFYPLYYGGIVTKVTPCVLDTPAIAPVTCATSCPLCTGLYGSACLLLQEVVMTPIYNNQPRNFVCPIKVYTGINGPPTPGMWWFGGGTNDILLDKTGIATPL